jgi:CBS domain-containing protein
MATVHSVLSYKGTQVHTIAADESVLAAANRMNDRAIGGLVVVEGDRMVGIVTERDILRRVVAAERNPSLTLVREVMSAPVACCRPETTLMECRTVMTEKRIRHLPVVDDRGLRGVVTIGDLMAQEVGEHQETIEFLNGYIFGPIPKDQFVK